MQVAVDVVNQEGHVLAKHQGPLVDSIIALLLALLAPYVLQLNLHALYRKQEPKQRVVLFNGIGRQDQLLGPLRLVVEGKTAPCVALTGFDLRLEGPVLDQTKVGEVCCLLAEAQVGRPVVKTEVVRKLHVVSQQGFWHTGWIVVHKKDAKLLLLRVVLHNDRLSVAVHEVSPVTDIDLSKQLLLLCLNARVNDVFHLADLSF